jgi:hypothetical protein
MQEFFWAVARAFTKFGMAIAASRPMMATTIMISTSVKPALLFFCVFIFALKHGADEQKAGYDYCCLARRLPSETMLNKSDTSRMNTSVNFWNRC